MKLTAPNVLGSIQQSGHGSIDAVFELVKDPIESAVFGSLEGRQGSRVIATRDAVREVGQILTLQPAEITNVILNHVNAAAIAPPFLKKMGITSLGDMIDVVSMGREVLSASQISRAGQLGQTQRLIQQGHALGLSNQEIARRVGQYYAPGRTGPQTAPPGQAGMASAHARRTMLTETNAAFNLGQQVAAGAQFKRGVRWTVSGSHDDKDVCDDNANRDTGYGRGIYEAWPRQNAPPIPTHPNCRCRYNIVDLGNGRRNDEPVPRHDPSRAPFVSRAPQNPDLDRRIRDQNRLESRSPTVKEESDLETAIVPDAIGKAATIDPPSAAPVNTVDDLNTFLTDLGAENVNLSGIAESGLKESTMTRIIADGFSRATADGIAMPRNVDVVYDLSQASLHGLYTPSTDTIMLNLADTKYWRDGKQAFQLQKTGWHAAGDRASTVTHEMGHKGTTDRLSSTVMDQLMLNGWKSLPSDIKAKLEAEFETSDFEVFKDMAQDSVSQYARTSPLEFVAEVYAGTIDGKTYSPGIYNLYDILGGPQTPAILASVPKIEVVVGPTILPPVPASATPAPSQTTEAALKNATDEWTFSVDNFTRQAILDYQEGDFAYEINNALRFKAAVPDAPNTDLSGRLAESLGLLDTAMRDAVVPVDVVVYRGVDLGSFTADQDAFDRVAYYETLKPGDIFTDAGFMSTSLDKDVTSGFLNQSGEGSEFDVLFELSVPKGTHGLYLSEGFLPGFESQKELLLDRDTVMQTTEVSRRADGVLVVKADVVLGTRPASILPTRVAPSHLAPLRSEVLAPGPFRVLTPTTKATKTVARALMEDRTTLAHQAWSETITPEQLKAGTDFLANRAAVTVNDFLRSNDRNQERFTEAEMRQMVANIDAAVGANMLPEPTTLFRGSRHLLVTGSSPGSIIVDPGFLWTTTSQDFADDYATSDGVLYEIHAPAGQPAMHDAGMFAFVKILPRDTPMRVLSSETLPSGATKIVMEPAPDPRLPSQAALQALVDREQALFDQWSWDRDDLTHDGMLQIARERVRLAQDPTLRSEGPARLDLATTQFMTALAPPPPIPSPAIAPELLASPSKTTTQEARAAIQAALGAGTIDSWSVDNLTRQLEAGDITPAQVIFELSTHESALEMTTADWWAGLSIHEKAAIASYTSKGYQAINDLLRGTEEFGAHDATTTTKKIDALDRAIDAYGPTEMDMTVRRAVGFLPDGHPLGSLQPGDLYTEPGYTSTTTDLSATSVSNIGPVNYEILVPAGSRGAYIGDHTSADENEHEFIIARGSTFQVTSVTDDLVKMRLVPAPALASAGPTVKDVQALINEELDAGKVLVGDALNLLDALDAGTVTPLDALDQLATIGGDATTAKATKLAAMTNVEFDATVKQLDVALDTDVITKSTYSTYGKALFNGDMTPAEVTKAVADLTAAQAPVTPPAKFTLPPQQQAEVDAMAMINAAIDTGQVTKSAGDQLKTDVFSGNMTPDAALTKLDTLIDDVSMVKAAKTINDAISEGKIVPGEGHDLVDALAAGDLTTKEALDQLAVWVAENPSTSFTTVDAELIDAYGLPGIDASKINALVNDLDSGVMTPQQVHEELQLAKAVAAASQVSVIPTVATAGVSVVSEINKAIDAGLIKDSDGSILKVQLFKDLVTKQDALDKLNALVAAGPPAASPFATTKEKVQQEIGAALLVSGINQTSLKILANQLDLGLATPQQILDKLKVIKASAGQPLAVNYDDAFKAIADAFSAAKITGSQSDAFSAALDDFTKSPQDVISELSLLGSPVPPKLPKSEGLSLNAAYAALDAAVDARTISSDERRQLIDKMTVTHELTVSEVLLKVLPASSLAPRSRGAMDIIEFIDSYDSTLGRLLMEAQTQAWVAANRPTDVDPNSGFGTASPWRAVQSYQDGDMMGTNTLIRNGEDLPSFAEDNVRRLDAALAETSIPTDIVVYRGFPGDPLLLNQSLADNIDFQVGDVITDPGFVSMSLSESVAKEFAASGQSDVQVVWKIVVPKGSQGLFVGTSDFGFGGALREQEVILPRDQAFRVVKHEEKDAPFGLTRHEFVLEMIPKPPSEIKEAV